MSGIYLDFNATTPLDPQVIAAIHKSLEDDWANPSSAHGTSARQAIERSRKHLAQMINCQMDDIIFMSGGTEANNIALHSAIKSNNTNDALPHVIISNVEHDSVMKYATMLENSGKIELTLAEVNRSTGILEPDVVLSHIKNSTCLISVMHANNETGIIMPINEIGQKLEMINLSRKQKHLPKILFHTDAAQSLGKVKVNVQQLGVDYLTIVGHKFYGPRIGALYARNLMENGSPVISLFCGGGQERSFRPGTENTPLIVGLGKAAQLVVENLEKYTTIMETRRNYLATQMKENIPGTVINFCVGNRLPNTLSIQVPQGRTAQSVLEGCHGKVLFSLGAACHSNRGKPSDILLASGLSINEATRTLRISVGRTTSENDIQRAVQIITKACNE